MQISSATFSISASVSSGYIGRLNNDRVRSVLVDMKSGLVMLSVIGNSDRAVS